MSVPQASVLCVGFFSDGPFPAHSGHRNGSPGVQDNMPARHLLLRACSTAVFVLLLGPSAFAQDALDLFHKMQQALGGADRIAAIKDFEEDGRGDAWTVTGRLMGEVRKRTRWIAPNLLRLDQAGPGDTYVLYFDGTAGWEILPERGTSRTTGVVIALEGDELAFAQRYLSGFMVDSWRGLWLADRIPGYTITSPAPNVVRISRDGRATDITLDPVTRLPVKQAVALPADPNRLPLDGNYFSEWELVEGVRFPTKRTTFRNGIKILDAKEIKTRINIGLRDEDLAAKPADFSPVLPDQ